MNRNSVILSSLAGLAGAVTITAGCLVVMGWALLPVLVTNSLYSWAIFLFLLLFSLAEIPVMLIGMRRIAASANPKAKGVALLVNTSYVLFGAVYAAPFILLTGRLALGALLASLSLIRFLSAIFYLTK